MDPEGAQRRRAWEGAVSGSADSIENGQAEPQEILGAGIEPIRSRLKRTPPGFPSGLCAGAWLSCAGTGGWRRRPEIDGPRALIFLLLCLLSSAPSLRPRACMGFFMRNMRVWRTAVCIRLNRYFPGRVAL
jgi:hypothetical protein